MPGARPLLGLITLVALALTAVPARASVSPQPDPSAATSKPGPLPTRDTSVTPKLEAVAADLPPTPMALHSAPPSSGWSASTVLIALGGAWLLFLGLGMMRRR